MSACYSLITPDIMVYFQRPPLYLALLEGVGRKNAIVKWTRFFFGFTNSINERKFGLPLQYSTFQTFFTTLYCDLFLE